jgi:hypothetical protein
MNSETQAFYQGAALILAVLAKTHDQPTLVKDLMRGLGIQVGDLESAQVYAEDMQCIKLALQTQ